MCAYISFEEVTATSQTSTGTWVDEDFASGLDLTDEDILSIQKLKPEEPQPAGDSFFSELRSNLSVSRSDITFCEDRVASVTGLPRPSSPGAETDYPLSPQLNRSIDKATAVEVPSTSSSPSSSQKSVNMGGSESKKDATTIPRYIMSEDPRDFLASSSRPRVSETEVTGNCRPWSDHVYFKLFLDTESRNATLVVLKCDISYVNVFTDQEHTLYKSRFIGGKTDGICEQFVFDLMKSDWEAKIPQSQAIELNVDIVMSSSPIHTCADSLVKLIQLEKSYLKFRKFDGKLNVMLRFAHGYGWDAKEDSTRQHVHEGLRKLFVEGVNLEVMSWETIVEEMRVDGIPTSDEENIRTIIRKRLTWNDLRASSNTANDSPVERNGAPSSKLLPDEEVDYYQAKLHRDLGRILHATERPTSLFDGAQQDY